MLWWKSDSSVMEENREGKGLFIEMLTHINISSNPLLATTTLLQDLARPILISCCPPVSTPFPLLPLYTPPKYFSLLRGPWGPKKAYRGSTDFFIIFENKKGTSLLRNICEKPFKCEVCQKGNFFLCFLLIMCGRFHRSIDTLTSVGNGTKFDNLCRYILFSA